MTGLIFVDTNIPVHARDVRNPRKQAHGYDVLSYLWQSRLGRISYQGAWWASLVIASAIAAGCERIFSKGLQHGMTIFGLIVENPFHSDFRLPKITSPLS